MDVILIYFLWFSEEIERLQEQLRRERVRNSDERSHYEKEADQIRRIATDRAQAEIDRIKEEECNKRSIILKKHTVIIPTTRICDTLT